MLTWHNLRKNIRQYSLSAKIIYQSLILLLIFCGVAGAVNEVNLDIVKRGQMIPVDTLLADSAYEMRVLIANDYVILGMSLGFQVWSPNGASWQWLSQPDGLGDNGIVTGVLGSRLFPEVDYCRFDMTGLLVTEANIDEVGRDSIMCGGTSLNLGIEAGPLDPIYSYNFIPDIPTMYGYYTLCFDSCFVPPAGDFIFCDPSGCGIPPTALWPYGGKCWVVTDVYEMNTYCDPAFVVCPGGDTPFRVYLRDDYGDPIVGDSSIWIEFVDCNTINPCPGSSQSFTTLYPAAPSDENGMVSFFMSGGGCDGNCYAIVKAPTYTIATVPVKALDINGDFVVSIRNDFDFSSCNDYNGDGLINFNDVNIFNAHVPHSCDVDPCDLFGYEFKLDPESNLIPGQQISLELALSNNNVDSSCYIGFVGFFYSQFGTGQDEELIENVSLNATLGPGEEALITVPYTIPPEGHGCLYAKFMTDCCDETIELSRCFQSTLHCKADSNVCYEMHIKLNTVPVIDDIWREFIPDGWTLDPFYVPSFPLYAPDSIRFYICTPNLSDLGDSASVIITACYNEDCTEFEQFENRVVLNSRTGDVNSDCYINVGDAVFLINFIFKFGPPPVPLDAGDANCDGMANVGDAVVIINYVFKGGAAPCLVE